MTRIGATRLTVALAVTCLLLVVAPSLCAQDDGSNVPLGDVARNLRRKQHGDPEVIDNDNLTQVLDQAQNEHLSGAALLFSLDGGEKNFHVSTPDVTCSLSFNANAASLLSDPAALDDLPRSELMKLDGPANIDGDTLQVTVHNATQWTLREVVVGLTIVRQASTGAGSYNGGAAIVPAAVNSPDESGEESIGKRPDVTFLLHMLGSAAPSSTAVFRTPLNFELFPDQEWHWAIVRAKGIPPQVPAQPASAELMPAESAPNSEASFPMKDRSSPPAPEVVAGPAQGAKSPAPKHATRPGPR